METLEEFHGRSEISGRILMWDHLHVRSSTCDLMWKFKHDAVVMMWDMGSFLLTTTIDEWQWSPLTTAHAQWQTVTNAHNDHLQPWQTTTHEHAKPRNHGGLQCQSPPTKKCKCAESGADKSNKQQEMATKATTEDNDNESQVMGKGKGIAKGVKYLRYITQLTTPSPTHF